MSLLEHAIPTCLPKLQAQAPKILPGVEICGEKRGNNHPCVITMTRTCMQQTQMTKKKKKKPLLLPWNKDIKRPTHPHQAETDSDRKGGTPGKVEYHNNTYNILLHYSTHLNCEPLGVATP